MFVMLIDQKETHEVLRQIVFKVTANRALDEDLLQEALIHLWLREQQCPGQTASWYLQSCRFFLQNHLRNGRSVDSNKHSHSNAAPSSAGCNGSPEPCADGCASADSVLGLVSAREIVSLLNKWLM